MKIDDQLKHMFPDPKDVWDWRIRRISLKEPEYDWKEMNAKLFRFVAEIIQYLLQQRTFNHWNIDSFSELDASNEKLGFKNIYEAMCGVNQSRQEEEYITKNLDKIESMIHDNIMMEHTDALIPRIDLEGNLYFEHRYYKNPDEK